MMRIALQIIVAWVAIDVILVILWAWACEGGKR